jgi:hypothetical protein
MSSRLVYWAPRVLTGAFALFLSIFALDVFADPVQFPWVLLDFAMHLIPAALVLAVLALAWRREWIGAVLLPVLAIAYLLFAWGRFPWPVYAAISGPLLLAGVLFALSGRAPRDPGQARPVSARG